MSDKIKPSEVSEVLLQQLQGISQSAKFDEVGTVLQVSDGVARIYGLRNAEANELLEFENGTMAKAIDGMGDIDLKGAFEMPLDRKAPGVIFRQPVKEPLQTGLKAVDSMIPIGRGQRELIIGDRQTGKTAIAVDTIINQKSFYEAGKPVYCIYVAIGQKASTVAALVQNLKEHGALPYTIIVSATAADPAAMQYYLSMMTCRNRLLLTVKYL